MNCAKSKQQRDVSPEILKEHRKVEEQAATIVELKAADDRQSAAIVAQENKIEGLIAIVKDQASQLQKVSAQLTAVRPDGRLATNE